MKRRNLILLVGGASSGAMSVGTGAFSSMEAERGVSVNVTNDEDAFIRYEKPSDGAETENGEEITLVRIRNQFGGTQELALVGVEYEDEDALRNVAVERYEVPEDPDEEFDEEHFADVDEDHVAIERGSTSSGFPDANDADAFGPGEWVRIVADAHVPAGESVDVEVTVTLKGVKGSISAQLFGGTREFTLEGKGPEPVEGLTFNGSRNANAEGASGNYTLDFWLANPDGSEFSDSTTQERDWDGTGNVNSGDAEENSETEDRRLLAVRFRETNQTFYRPDCGIDEDDVPWDAETFSEGDENGQSACD